MQHEPPVVIYHANCSDGFGAAWAAWRHFNRDVELVPASYGKAPPPLRAGQQVYIVDFSYPPDVLTQLCATNGVTVIDHHKTALDNMNAHFNMGEDGSQPFEYYNESLKLSFNFDLNHSGAILTWKYFFGGLPPPELLLHIEDRDLWKFAMPNTRSVLAALNSYTQDIVVWDELMSADLAELSVEGKAIERMYQKDVRNIVETTQRMAWVGGYNVPVSNAPGQFASDVGAILAEGHSFSATYYDTANGRKFSLRSINGVGLDVAEIAKQFGGGGHKHAAGFSVPKEHELAVL